MGCRVKGRRLLLTALPAVLLAASSCARLTPEEAEARAGQQFFALSLRAAGDVNSYLGAPSSLSVCLYQLTDRRAFDALRDSPGGLAELLACEKFDDAVVGRERIFINPGEKRIEEFERRRGARYVALAAGYHNASAASSTLLLELPAVVAKRRKRPPPRLGAVFECDRMLPDRSVK